MNKHFGAIRRRWFLVAAGALVYTGSAWATTNSCPNAEGTGPVNNGNATTTGVTIPAAGTGTPLSNSLTGLGATGCTAVDLNFSNFGVAGTFTGNNSSAAGTYLAETPAGTGGGDDTLLFATVNGTATGGADGAANDAINNWGDATKDTTVADQINFNVNNSGNNPAEVINSVLLTVTNPVLGGSGASGSIVIDICEGSQTGVITTAGGCTGTFVTQTLTLATNATQTLTVSLPTLPGAFDITTIVNLNVVGNANPVGFDTLSETFEEGAPEPSTFVLFGAALAALGLLRFRAHRKAAVRSAE